MKKFIKNKKADIPVMILVFGVFAICGLAILSFIVSNHMSMENNSLGVEVIEELNSDVEKFYFYSEIYGDDEAAKRIDGVVIRGNQLIIKKSNDIILVIYTKSL